VTTRRRKDRITSTLSFGLPDIHAALAKLERPRVGLVANASAELLVDCARTLVPAVDPADVAILRTATDLFWASSVDDNGPSALTSAELYGLVPDNDKELTLVEDIWEHIVSSVACATDFQHDTGIDMAAWAAYHVVCVANIQAMRHSGSKLGAQRTYSQADAWARQWFSDLVKHSGTREPRSIRVEQMENAKVLSAGFTRSR
jgi:hypothetical protein